MLTPDKVVEVMKVVEPRVRMEVLQNAINKIKDLAPTNAIYEAAAGLVLSVLQDEKAEQLQSELSAAHEDYIDTKEDREKFGPEFAAMSLDGLSREKLVQLQASAKRTGDTHLRMSCDQAIREMDDRALADQIVDDLFGRRKQTTQAVA